MLLLIGTIIGLVLGLTGAGGSVFAVPLLMLLGGFTIDTAVGISLGAVAASTLYGTLRNIRSSSALWLPGLILAGVGALAAPLGQWLGSQVPALGLLIGFNFLAVIIALRMWLSAIRTPEFAKVVRAGNFSQQQKSGMLCKLSPTGQFELRPRCLTGLLIGGGVVGLLSGLFGVGGGFLIVPLLLALSPITMAQAISTSLVIIAIISGSGFGSHLMLNNSHLSNSDFLTTLALVSTGGIVGMIVGQLLSQKIATPLLQKIFSISLIIVSITTLVTRL
jgi:uncharacterized membrane protein YfcA